MQRSKAYKAAAEKISEDKQYRAEEAIKLVKETSSKKFDETVDVVMRLGVDPPQGRSDGPRHREPSQRNRQDSPGPCFRHR